MDGGQPPKFRKLRTAKARLTNQLAVCLRVKPSTQHTAKTFPCMSRGVFVDAARSVGCPVLQADYDADGDIAVVARTFCELTGLNASQLPLLATLLGNDFIDAEEFFAIFYHNVIKKTECGRGRHPKIKGIISWLVEHKHLSGKALINKVLMLSKARERSNANTIHESIHNYIDLKSNLISHVQTRLSLKSHKDRAPRPLPQWLVNAYRHHYISHEVADILTQRYFISPPHVEDPMLDSAYGVVRPLVACVFTMLWQSSLRKKGDGAKERAKVGKSINECANVGNLIKERANVGKSIKECANVGKSINECANVGNLIKERANVGKSINECANVGMVIKDGGKERMGDNFGVNVGMVIKDGGNERMGDNFGGNERMCDNVDGVNERMCDNFGVKKNINPKTEEIENLEIGGIKKPQTKEIENLENGTEEKLEKNGAPKIPQTEEISEKSEKAGALKKPQTEEILEPGALKKPRNPNIKKYKKNKNGPPTRPHSTASLKWYIRRGYTLWADKVVLTFDEGLPSLNDVAKMSAGDKKSVFYHALQSRLDLLDLDLPSDLEIILECVVYWYRVGRKVKNGAAISYTHVLTVLVCVFMFYVIDGKVGRRRTSKDFKTRLRRRVEGESELEREIEGEGGKVREKEREVEGGEVGENEREGEEVREKEREGGNERELDGEGGVEGEGEEVREKEREEETEMSEKETQKTEKESKEKEMSETEKETKESEKETKEGETEMSEKETEKSEKESKESEKETEKSEKESVPKFCDPISVTHLLSTLTTEECVRASYHLREYHHMDHSVTDSTYDR
ncbi:hypothetical protein Pcinc_030960, partial [Petrolisthes cinctipes]